jgi:hypothetical protein
VAVARHLEVHGVVPGEVVKQSGPDGEGPSMHVHDPEGNMVELKEPWSKQVPTPVNQ